MADKIKKRRDTAANWTANNPVLLDGQLGFETDTRLFKIGDGTTAWNSLSYANEGYFTLQFGNSGMNPADSTTYYLPVGRMAYQTTDNLVDSNLGFPFKVVAAFVTISNSTTAGTGETSTFKLRNVTQATSATLVTGATNATVGTTLLSHTATGLNISVGAGDSICGQWDTPAWVTNPVSCIVLINIICKRA